MEEIKEKKFIIEAKGEVPFAQPTGDGYELFNNERTMKFCARRQQLLDSDTGEQKTCFAVFCSKATRGPAGTGKPRSQ